MPAVPNHPAFAYAIIRALEQRLSSVCRVITESDAAIPASEAWYALDSSGQERLMNDAVDLANALVDSFPLLLEYDDENSSVLVYSPAVNSLADGDIAIENARIELQIFLSEKPEVIKTKPSLLSGDYDFGREWYGIPCAEKYWKAGRILYEDLEIISRQDYVTWDRIVNPELGVRVPLLLAFQRELERAYELDKTVIKRVMEYHFGIVSHRGKFASMRGHIKENADEKTVFFIPKEQLPDEIMTIRTKHFQPTFLQLFMNNDWAVTFHIKGETEKVEPWIGLDIQAFEVPENIIVVKCWDD